MNDWVPEERPVPDGLEEDAEHETFPPPATRFNTVADQLAAANPDVLKRLTNWGTGEANWGHTEIGNE